MLVRVNIECQMPHCRQSFDGFPHNKLRVTGAVNQRAKSWYIENTYLISLKRLHKRLN